MLHFGVDEKYWKSARSRSRQATSATPQRCPTCWRKFHRIKRSPRPPALGPMTRADAIIPPRKNAQLWQASDSWCCCAKRSLKSLQISRAGFVAKTGRLSPSKPRREKGELRQTSWPSAMARDCDRQVASLQIHAAVLNRIWHARHRVRRISTCEKIINRLSPNLCNRAHLKPKVISLLHNI